MHFLLLPWQYLKRVDADIGRYIIRKPRILIEAILHIPPITGRLSFVGEVVIGCLCLVGSWIATGISPQFFIDEVADGVFVEVVS